MSARDWRAVREGETHAAAKTKQNNTPESLIVGVGASGALLAGAAIVFITLVGLVSFNVWPTSRDRLSIPSIELQAANGAHDQTVASTGTGSTQPPSSTAPSATGSAGGGAGGGGDSGGGGGNGGKQGSKAPSTTTPSTPPAPVATGGGDSVGGSGDTGEKTPPVSAGKGGDQGSTPPTQEKGKAGSTRPKEGKAVDSGETTPNSGNSPGRGRGNKHDQDDSTSALPSTSGKAKGSGRGRGQSKK